MGKKKRKKQQRITPPEHKVGFEQEPPTDTPVVDWAIIGFVWIVPFFVYLYNAPRTPFSCGDALELATASFTSGVAHAPGYPLFLMIGGILSTILPGSVTFKFATYTAFLGATVVLFVYLFARRVSRSRSIALVAASTYAFSYHQWLYSMVTEVSVLSALFGSVLLLATWRVYDDGLANDSDKLWKSLCAIAFLVGLSLTHHYLIVLFFPGIFWVLYKHVKLGFRKFSLKKCAAIGTCFLLGISPLLYLPLAAAQEPYINSGNIDSLSTFIRHLLRSDYGSFRLTQGDDGFSDNPRVFGELASFYVEMIGKSFSWLGAALLAVGVVVTLIRNNALTRLLVTSFVLSGIGFFLFSRMPPTSVATRLTLEKFLAISFVIVPIFIAVGLEFLIRQRKRFICVAAILPVMLFIINSPKLHLRTFRSSQHFGEDLFRSVAPDGVLIVIGDAPLFLSWYLQQVLNLRTDIKIIAVSSKMYTTTEALRRRFPGLTIPDSIIWEDQFVRELIEKNVDRIPMYTFGIPGEKLSSFGLNSNPFALQPHGLVSSVTRRFDPLESDEDLWRGYEIQTKLTGGLTENYCVAEINDIYTRALHNRAAFFDMNGRRRKAIAYAEAALRFDPDSVPTQKMLNELRK